MAKPSAFLESMVKKPVSFGEFRLADKANTYTNQIKGITDKKTPLYGAGNIDLTKRPQYKYPDGTVATVESMSFNDNGLEVLIPTISSDGKKMADDEAIDNYYKTGQYLGKFPTINSANAYAEALHKQQELMYSGELPGMNKPSAFLESMAEKPFSFGDFRLADTQNAVDNSLKPKISTTDAIAMSLLSRGTQDNKAQIDALARAAYKTQNENNAIKNYVLPPTGNDDINPFGGYVSQPGTYNQAYDNTLKRDTTNAGDYGKNLGESGLNVGESLAYGAGTTTNELQKAGNNLLGLPGQLFYGGLSALTGIFGKNDVSDWFAKQSEGAANLDLLGEKALEEALEKQYGDKLTESDRFVSDINRGATNMLASFATGNVAGKALSLPVSFATKLAFGTNAYSRGVDQALDEGAPIDKAILYGTASAIAETFIESIAGGIPGLGKGISGKVMSAFNKSPKALKTLLDIVGEGGEEVLSAALDPYLQRISYNPNAESATLNDLVRAFESGTIISTIFQGANAAGGKAAQPIPQNPIQTQQNLSAETRPANIAEAVLPIIQTLPNRALPPVGITHTQQILPAQLFRGTAQNADISNLPLPNIAIGQFGSSKNNIANTPFGVVEYGTDDQYNNSSSDKVISGNADSNISSSNEGAGKLGNSYADVIIRDGSQLEKGILKPNVTYQSGEYDYIYKTNEDGLIKNAHTDSLQIKNHSGRLNHNPNTYGKVDGDQAGHLFGDRFGGSPELDNLVSQAKRVNQSEFKVLENHWANALKNRQQVAVDITINYANGGIRPVSFDVSYTLDGVPFFSSISN